MRISRSRRPIPISLFTGILLLAGLLSGCASRGIQMPESQFLRILENKSGLIAYVGMDGNLYTINQAGEEKTQITNDAGLYPPDFVFQYRLFAWSPIENTLAFTGLDPAGWTLNVAEPESDEETLTEIYQDANSYPAFIQWTPDGKEVSFLTIPPGAGLASDPSLSLWVVSADSGPAAKALLNSYPLYFAWEPEAGRALVHAGRANAEGGGTTLALVNHAGSAPEVLSVNPAEFHAPAWSPDGERMLVAVYTASGEKALVIMNRSGKTLQTLTTYEKAIAFSWSPDGKHVAYILSDTDRQGVLGALTVVDLENPEDAFTTPESLVQAFFWSPSGEQIVYFTKTLSVDEGQDNLTYGLGLNFIDVKKQESRAMLIGENLFLFQPSPQFHAFLQYFDQFQQSATIWSPDENYIVLPVLLETQGTILVVPVSGTLEPRPIDVGMMAFWSWK